MSENKDLYAMRHSLAHIMATAVQRLWPEAKFGIGPVIDHGFYYDIDLGDKTISEDDFAKIEEEMKKVINEDQQFAQSDKNVDEAIKWAEEAGQPYKTELLNDLKREGTTSAKDLDADTMGVAADSSAVDSVSFYTNGDFVDLCRGPHVESTGKVGAFKLYKVAGAYWRGDENKPMLQRLYGVAYKTQEEVDDFLTTLEEARKRDHRKLGKQLEIYTTSPLVGSGLPLFLPKGTILRDKLEALSQQIRKAKGFQRVWTPHIAKKELYETSGHWDKFGDELFLVESQETDDKFVLKPMNCPHHIQLYASQPHSYKDLPIKYMHNTVIYRDEKSGELHGLSRVRSATQDDSHVYCTEEQIEDVVSELVDGAKELYKAIDMELILKLSTRDDEDKYHGDAEVWEKAQNILEKVAKDKGLDYTLDDGEAAFYGPKLDFIAVDALDREWQLATVQLDFVQPARFGITYTDENNTDKTPVQIHAAFLGSTERFLSVYIEHTAGHFPFWLAPEQIRILTVNDQVGDYVTEVNNALKDIVLNKPLKYNELRVAIDDRNESLGKKIREAETQKVPMMLILGPKDQAEKQVSVRTSDGESKIPLDELKGFVLENAT